MVNDPTSTHSVATESPLRKLAADIAPLAFGFAWIALFLHMGSEGTERSGTCILFFLTLEVLLWGYVVFFDRSRWRRWISFTTLSLFGIHGWYLLITHGHELWHNIRVYILR